MAGVDIAKGALEAMEGIITGAQKTNQVAQALQRQVELPTKLRNGDAA